MESWARCRTGRLSRRLTFAQRCKVLKEIDRSRADTILVDETRSNIAREYGFGILLRQAIDQLVQTNMVDKRFRHA